ncbi:hypothetical protein FRC10_011774 [Ceratobasidium sp. 414]|nr:hypothetical protein FRC10_011774 [Ceratobasidium sp. 414]
MASNTSCEAGFEFPTAVGIKVFSSLEEVVGTVSASRVVAGLAAKGKMVVICGAGISVSAGIPDYSSKDGLWNQVLVPASAGRTAVKGSGLFRSYLSAQGENLQVLQKLMASYRRTARTAALTPFHAFLRRALEQGRVVKCLTRNFDGLETRDRPDLEEKVVMLHGDNRVLTCGDGRCPNVFGDDVESYEADFLAGNPVFCPSCCARRDERLTRGKRITVNPKPLRPAVLLDGQFEYELKAGYLVTTVAHEVEDCDTLLVVGTRLKGETWTLVRDLARIVREREGAVVYLDRTDLSPVRSNHFNAVFDFHLKMDVQTCAQAMLEILDKVGFLGSLGTSEQASDIWVELFEQPLTALHSNEAPFLEIPHCCQCSMGDPDSIVQCVSCRLYYCFEVPDEIDKNMCVKLNYYSSEDPAPRLAAILSSFRCFECHDRTVGLYPADNTFPQHHVNAIPQFYESPSVQPRLVYIIYYLSQFWPQAQYMMINVANAWRARGWACHCIPVRFQSISPETVLSVDLPWQPMTYSTIVVFLTHGSSGKKRYQITDKLELAPGEFLTMTLRSAERLLRQARVSCGFVLACGHVYDVQENVSDIQRWIDGSGMLRCLVGFTNKRLLPCYLVNVITQVSIVLLGFTEWNDTYLMDTWLRDTFACTHSDVIRFATRQEPTLFCFSPFQTRPLGKELPNLLRTCPCKKPASADPGKRSRKIWKVTHDDVGKKSGKNGKPTLLKDVVIKATCSYCNAWWKMRQSDLPGTLHRCGGLYCAKIPYFMPDEDKMDVDP